MLSTLPILGQVLLSSHELVWTGKESVQKIKIKMLQAQWYVSLFPALRRQADDPLHQLWAPICTHVYPYPCKHTYKHTKMIFKRSCHTTKYFKVDIIKLAFLKRFIYSFQNFKLKHIEIHMYIYISIYAQQDLNVIIVSSSS